MAPTTTWTASETGSGTWTASEAPIGSWQGERYLLVYDGLASTPTNEPTSAMGTDVDAFLRAKLLSIGRRAIPGVHGRRASASSRHP